MKCRARSMRFALRHAGHLEREGDVVDDVAPGERRLLLEHHADRCVRTGDRLAGDARPCPRSCASRPPMMLNKVDLPQPDGPMIDEEFALAHAERDVVDGGDRAFRRLEALRRRRRRRGWRRRCCMREGRAWQHLTSLLRGHRGGHHRRRSPARRAHRPPRPRRLRPPRSPCSKTLRQIGNRR